MKILVVLTLLISSFSAMANEDVYKIQVKNFFLHHAHQIIEELHPLDSELVSQHDIQIITQAMDELEIQVVFENLIDNSGSIVDAIGIPGKLILNGDSWLEFYKKNSDIRTLVLHEMLRVSGINDDHFKISLPVFYTLFENNTAQYKNLYCDLHVETTYYKSKFSTLSANSYMRHFSDAQVDIRNQMENECKSKDGILDSRISFQFAFKRRNNNGFSETVRAVEGIGQCEKRKIKKRKKRDIRQDRCFKLNSCLQLFDNKKVKQTYSEDYNHIIDQWEQNKC
ncbi:MAG: hypothetical protein CME62_07965 [Halobacteriovoraceae bacterium]|nr:hypothetical protein [Halobacteriovoraceae bacterium]|tara:strand:+ start:8738 stop:9583 length:846 start_codon:yes stop_codon:yes gene_type:complete